MESTNKKHISNLVSQFVVNGIRNVVVSPGSRNAPLTIAFEAHPEMNVHLIHDERVAAFYALGMAEGLGESVAICCTSGSAALNYAPAIAEAYYRQVPLIVLTADRPSALIDQGDGQCIRQNGIYNNFIKASFVLPEEDGEIDISIAAEKEVNKALVQLFCPPQGPVHINVPLNEPLYETVSIPEFTNLTKVECDVVVDISISEKILEEWQAAQKKLIIVGQLAGSEQIKPLLDAVAQQSSVAILVENTSNLQNFHLYNHCIDRSLATISEDEITAFQPDLILSFGGAIVSKKIKAFLRKCSPQHNWRLGHYLIDEDTFWSKTETIKLAPHQFLKQLAKLDDATLSTYGKRWKMKDFEAMEKHQSFLNAAPFSDLIVTDFIIDTIPDGANLQMANSSVVRYCQLFNPIAGIKYFSNRGVSGIDGSTSTAVGMAKAKPTELVVLITGDISFFYDSNGLWIEPLPANLRIFLINNNGGGIFNILEGSRLAKQNKLFVAPHTAKASSVCEAYGVEYSYADSVDSLENNVHDFYVHSRNNRPKLMEVNTADCPNHQTLMAYFDALK